MKFTSKALTAAAVGAAAVSAQSSNMSLCDKYTVAKLMNNTSENQLTLLTLLVNTAVIGNFSTAADGSYVAGILANGTANDSNGDSKKVSLLKYFDGSLLSTNQNGQAASVNFLDGGGAAPLMAGKPANDETSMQYTLLTHLYQVFGVLLGCSMMGDGMAFPSYQGSPDMYAVHKFMDLDVPETTYFVAQVGAAAKSFGVSSDDITTVANALTTTFNYRCAAASALATGATPASQSICVDSSCPIAANSTCDGVEAAVAPKSVNSTSTSTTSSSGASGMTSTAAGSAPSASASTTHDSAVSMVANTLGALALAGGAIAAAALF